MVRLRLVVALTAFAAGSLSSSSLTQEAQVRDKCPQESPMRDSTTRTASLVKLAERGWWNLEGGDRSLGAEQMRAAIRGGLRDPVVYADLAGGLFLIQRFDEALTVFREAAELWPECGWPLARAAYALEGLGRLAEAAEMRRRSGVLLPGLPY